MGETTELIQKRIRHTKTTMANMAGIVCPILALVFPQHTVAILTIDCALNSMGNIAAADAKPQETTVTTK